MMLILTGNDFGTWAFTFPSSPRFEAHSLDAMEQGDNCHF